MDPTDKYLKHRLKIISVSIPEVIFDAELERTVIDANGNLVGITTTSKVTGFDIPLTEQFIKDLPVQKIIIRDGQKFEVHEHTHIINIENSRIFGSHSIKFGYRQYIHGYRRVCR